MGMDIDVLPDDPYDPPKSDHKFVWNADGDERAFIIFTGIEFIRGITGLGFIVDLPVFIGCIRARYRQDKGLYKGLIDGGMPKSWFMLGGIITVAIGAVPWLNGFVIAASHEVMEFFTVALTLFILNPFLFWAAWMLQPRATRYVNGIRPKARK